MKKSQIRLVMFAMVTLLATASMTAQIGFNDNVKDAPQVPLDGGLAALLIGGAAYGIKKLRDRKKH